MGRLVDGESPPEVEVRPYRNRFFAVYMDGNRYALRSTRGAAEVEALLAGLW